MPDANPGSKIVRPLSLITSPSLVTSQPLRLSASGESAFYSASQLVQDVRRHEVEVRPPDVLHSDWDCTMEDVEHKPAVRLGLHLVKGLKQAAADRIVAARADGFFETAEELARRADLEHLDMQQLAAADALLSLSGHRRNQVWDAAALHRLLALLKDAAVDEDVLDLEEAAEGEAVLWDYRTLGLSLRSHPLALLRSQLKPYATASKLSNVPNGIAISYCGIVTLRQSPESAKGVIFVSLEDETGNVQIIVWPSVRDEYRQVLMRSRLLAVKGRWQRDGDACSLIATELHDLTQLLGNLPTESRNFK